MDGKQRRNIWKEKQIFFIIWLVVMIAAFLWLLGVNDANLINSDDSSELILAEMLSHKNLFLTRGWIYSTELRVINTQIIRAFLFLFTDSWTTVRVVGNLILYLWMLLSYAFFIRQLTEEWKWFWFTAPFLLVPFSYEAFYVIGLMGHYIPYIALSFFILGLWLYLYREKKYKKTAHGVLLACSFLSCLGGIRQVQMTFAPMVIAVFFLVLERSNEIGSLGAFLKKTCYLWTSLLCGMAGYLVNIKILSKWFLFATYEKLQLIQPTFERLQPVLRYFLNAFGYTETSVPQTDVFSLKGILLLLSLCFLGVWVLMVRILWRRRRKLLPESAFLLWFTLAGLFLNMFLFMFTDIPISPRYYILSIVMYAPLLMVFYKESGLSAEVRRFFFLGTAALVCILGAKEYEKCLHWTGNELRKGHIAYLEEQGYTFGYANFWNANVLTELTEGKIEMVGLYSEGESEPNLNSWLTKLENLYPLENHGPVFLLLQQNELRRSERLIRGREPVYEGGGYYVYLYEDTDEFLTLINRNEEEEHGEE